MESVNQRVFRLLGFEHGVQKRLAEHLGISDRNVNMWKERGSAINSEFIPMIADFLGVTDTYLLRGKDTRSRFLPPYADEIPTLVYCIDWKEQTFYGAILGLTVFT